MLWALDRYFVYKLQLHHSLKGTIKIPLLLTWMVHLNHDCMPLMSVPDCGINGEILQHSMIHNLKWPGEFDEAFWGIMILFCKMHYFVVTYRLWNILSSKISWIGMLVMEFHRQKKDKKLKLISYLETIFLHFMIYYISNYSLMKQHTKCQYLFGFSKKCF